VAIRHKSSLRETEEEIQMKKNVKKLALEITGLLALAVALVVIGVTVAACGNMGTSTTTTSPTASPTAVLGVVDADGTHMVLPVVGKKGEVAPVNTTHDARTPASFNFRPFTAYGKPALTWHSLVSAVADAQAGWYRKAVNDRSRATGFNWSDIKKWAFDPQVMKAYTLTIQVFGAGFSDSQARNIAAGLVGQSLADRLPIVRHPDGILINTRSVGFHKVGDFLDVRRMVRVSLSPVVYNKNGKVTGVRGNSGIFADCLNIWRLGKVVKHPAKPPGKTPKKHHKKHPLTPKNWKQDAYVKGHAPVGGGPNATKGPGKPTKKPAKPGPTPYTPPPAPAPSPSPTPGATSTPTPDPQPTPSPEFPTPAATATATPPGM
jgi:hypothetical protein